MKELAHQKVEGFQPSALCAKDIPFKDANRAEQFGQKMQRRQAGIAAAKAQREAER